MSIIRHGRELVGALNRRRSHSRVGYIGWVGRQNVGDDAMFEAAQQLMGGNLELLQTLNREVLLDRLGAGGSKAFTGVLLGGGTLINDDRLAIIEWLIERDVPLFALGTGVGSAGFSMVDESVNPRWIAALGAFRMLGVRGPRSCEKLQQAGVPKAEVIGDLALALTPDAALANYEARRVIVNVAPASEGSEASQSSVVQSSIAEVLRKLMYDGWTPVPVAFDAADVRPLQNLMRDIGVDQSVLRPADFASYCEIAKTVSLSIGVRLHSSVFATSCGIPNVLIAYRDKCHDFARSVDMEDALIDFHAMDVDDLLRVVMNRIDGGEHLGHSLHNRSLTLRAQIENCAARIQSECL